ncbi:MAG: NTP transferase domain-containing protein [Thaumarchaeota archaeon]|nr:NTP transferase domain-containing protein [Nitrososphaerota archaeon]
MSYVSARAAIILDTQQEVEQASTDYLDSDKQNTLLEYVLDAVWTVADQIYVVFRKEPDLRLVESISPFGVKVIIHREDSSIVSAVVSGLQAAKSEHCFVVSGNIPFMKPNVVHALFESARNYDAAIPKWANGNIESLTSVYARKAFIKVATRGADITSMSSVIDNLYAVRYVNVEEELKPLDPDLYSFMAVKNAEDMEKARAIASIKSKRL